MADDMGWSDIGCYGSEIDTPNIDRIAREGMLFTQFYNNGKCTTTRASLLTGLYPRKGGKGIELLGPEMLTLGEGMRIAGYQTGLSGKWHNGSKQPHRPFDRGFDRSFGLWDGACNFFNPSIRDPEFKGGKRRFFGRNDEHITDFPDDFFTTDAFTDHALETIRKQAAGEAPFFHYLPFTAPHYPLHARPENIKKYAGKYSEGWDALRQRRYARQVEAGLIDPAVYPDPGHNPDNVNWEKGQNPDLRWETLRMETYAAMVDCMDQNIGRILDLLDELKIDDNTMIIFLSDNGGCAETPGGNDTAQIPGPKDFYTHVGPNWAYAQNTPFRRYKAHTHEGGIATPFVVRWPKKIPAASKSEQVGHIIDLLPTFLDVAGSTYPESHNGNRLIPVEGISLLPSLVAPDKTIGREQPLYWHWAKKRAVRKGDWKVVWEKKNWELYNLAENRTETKDLAQMEPERTAEMADLWEAWADKTGVKY